MKAPCFVRYPSLSGWASELAGGTSLPGSPNKDEKNPAEGGGYNRNKDKGKKREKGEECTKRSTGRTTRAVSLIREIRDASSK